MMVAIALGLAIVLGLASGGREPVFAQNADSPPAADLVEAGDAAPTDITLQKMIREGGAILWVLMALGFVALIMAFYLFLTVTPKREAPRTLMRRATEQVRAGDIRGAYQMCEGRDELLAKVLYAGLKMSAQERYIIQESMESEGERGAADLWQRISYMNNIGVIAPLLGLLGTVWGMIGAFGAIALDNAQVKGLAMAYNVSQAMITTAGGLLLAIPALVSYYYFRGRVVSIVSQVEAHASEFVELIVRNRSE
jgi:biopolymer transport protein ExbB